MNALPLPSADVIERLGWTLLHSLWQIAALALLLALGRRVCRSPGSRYLLAMLALACCIVVPVLTFTCLPVAVVPPPPAALVPAAAPLIVTTALPEGGARMAPQPVARPVKISHVIVPSALWRLWLRQALPWVVALWLVGVGWGLLRHLAGLRSLHRLRHQGIAAVSAEVQALFDHSRLRLGLRRATRVFESARVLTPMVIGTLKPVVLLPASVLSGIDTRQLEALIAHELAHLRRWDDVANLLQCAGETVLFYHPALWWISRIAREERELCCDDLAVARGVQRQDLAHALGRLALWQTAARQPSLAATGHMPVLARIRRLLHPAAPPPLATGSWPLAMLVLLAAALLLITPQTQAGAKITRGRILDRNGLVLAESTAESVRRYPYQSLAAHILGFSGRLKAGSDEQAGRSGIELAYDKALAGKTDVVLSLDARLQHLAENTMREAGCQGACVLIDPETGDLLAMASVPGYDLNDWIPLRQAYYEKLSKDPRNPLLPRAYGGNYFPASTFKLVTALAALKSGAIDENTMMSGPSALKIDGRTFHNWNSEDEGPMNVERAILRSNNTWFYQAAAKTTLAPILDVAAQLGFGQVTGLPLRESPGGLPSDDYYQEHFGHRIRPRDLPSIAVGQVVEVTPLQVAVATAAFGNGGKVWIPRLTMDQPKARLRNNLLDHGITQAHLDIIKRGMVSVVNDKDGTGGRAKIPGVTVAGKTGTAQWKIYNDNSFNRNLAWFTGFAPAEHPRLAFAIVYEGRPGESVSGGALCGPLVKTIVGESLAILDGKKYEVTALSANYTVISDYPDFPTDHWVKTARRKDFGGHVILYNSWANESPAAEGAGWHFGNSVVVISDGGVITGKDVKVGGDGKVQVGDSEARLVIHPGTLPSLGAIVDEKHWHLPATLEAEPAVSPPSASTWSPLKLYFLPPPALQAFADSVRSAPFGIGPQAPSPHAPLKTSRPPLLDAKGFPLPHPRQAPFLPAGEPKTAEEALDRWVKGSRVVTEKTLIGKY